jgi:hypothetical protein
MLRRLSDRLRRLERRIVRAGMRVVALFAERRMTRAMDAKRPRTSRPGPSVDADPQAERRAP